MAKGSAYVKAIKLIEHKKYGTKAPSFRSKAEKGATVRVMNQILKGKTKPVGKKERTRFYNQLRRSKHFGLDFRVAFKWHTRFFSGFIGATIQETLINNMKRVLDQINNGDTSPNILEDIVGNETKLKNEAIQIRQIAINQIGNMERDFDFSWWNRRLRKFKVMLFKIDYWSGLPLKTRQILRNK